MTELPHPPRLSGPARRLVRPLLLAVLLFPSCRVTDLPLWAPKRLGPEDAEVEAVRNVAYYLGPEKDAAKHTLDLYLPRGRQGFPVVLLVHGGAWIMGDN